MTRADLLVRRALPALPPAKSPTPKTQTPGARRRYGIGKRIDRALKQQKPAPIEPDWKKRRERYLAETGRV